MRIKNILKLYILTALLAVSIPGARSAVITEHTLDSLKTALSSASTSKDSISTLYNIFDVIITKYDKETAKKHALAYLRMLYETSMRNRDLAAAIDAICYASELDRNNIRFQDSLLKLLNDKRLGVNNRVLESRSYIQLQKFRAGARDTTLSIQQRHEHFKSLVIMANDSSRMSDTFERLDTHLALAVYGGALVQPDRLANYLKELEELIEQSASKRSPLTFFFYSQAPILFNEMEYYKDAVRTDRKMIEVLNSLIEDNHKKGRVFRNYDRVLYQTYRRLLSNYPELKPGEADEIYAKIKDLEKTMAKADIHHLAPVDAEAMKNMADHNYKSALANFRLLMSSTVYRHRPRYIDCYRQAAIQTNSVEDLIKSQNLYIDLLKEQSQAALSDDYARMALSLELDSIERDHLNAKADIKKLKEDVRLSSEKITIIFLAGVGILFVTLTLFQVTAKRRARKLAEKLKESNENLRNERDALRRTQTQLTEARDRARQAVRQKSEFIHNVSHEISDPVKSIVGFSQIIVDSVPEDKRRYMSGFMDIIQHNSQILQRLVSDILDSVEMDKVSTTVTANNFSLSDTCNLVAESFRPRLNPEVRLLVEPVKIIGNPSDSSDRIDSDRDRLEQVLNNVISNAVKFTEKGKITITPSIDRDNGMASIAVSDTGPGIPVGKEDLIFERFEKIGRYNSGLGLGLFVGRRVTRILGGDLTLDPTFRHGARFIISIPISLKNNNHIPPLQNN